MTSFDVARVIKKTARTGEVGRIGALDPEVNGVLPICIGKGTKIISYIVNSDKVYEIEFKLDIKTTTYGSEGSMIEEKNLSSIGNEGILKAIYSFEKEYS